MEPNTPVSQTPAPAPVAQTTGHLEGPTAYLKFAWNIFTKHWNVVGLIVILPTVAIYIGQLLIQTENIVAVVIAFIIMIAGYIFSIASAPAAIQAVHRIATDPGTPISIKAQYRFGLSLFWSIILVGIIGGFAFFGSAALLIIPGIVVWVYGSMYAYALVIDGKKGFSAFTESYSLVRGRWWPVLGNILFMVLIMLVIQLILMGVTFLLALIFGVSMFGPQVEPSIGFMVISLIVGLLQTAIIGPIGIAYLYRLYSSLKSTRATPAPSVKAFKGWMIAFLCIGVLALIAMFITVPLIALGSARSKAMQAQQNAQERMMEIQQQINSQQQ